MNGTKLVAGQSVFSPTEITLPYVYRLLIDHCKERETIVSSETFSEVNFFLKVETGLTLLETS